MDVIRDSERLIKSHSYSLVALKLGREVVFGPDVVSANNFSLDHLKYIYTCTCPTKTCHRSED